MFLYEAEGMTVHATSQRSQRKRRPISISSASSGNGSSRWPEAWARSGGCTRSTRGCVRPARADRWRRHSTSSNATSPKAKGRCGSARRCAKASSVYGVPSAVARALQAVQRAAFDVPFAPPMCVPCARCVAESRPRVRRATLNAVTAACAISTSSCRCSNCDGGTNIPRYVSPRRSTHCEPCAMSGRFQRKTASFSRRATASCERSNFACG